MPVRCASNLPAKESRWSLAMVFFLHQEMGGLQGSLQLAIFLIPYRYSALQLKIDPRFRHQMSNQGKARIGSRGEGPLTWHPQVNDWPGESP